MKYKHFEHKECEFYPCQFAGQNCLFCYCPLYNKNCLGIYDPTTTIKDCSKCYLPHLEENYDSVLDVLKGKEINWRSTTPPKIKDED